jgi:hypothetical protein
MNRRAINTTTVFKTRLRKDLANAANPFLFIANMSQCYC